jgi:hypothetical protein
MWRETQKLVVDVLGDEVQEVPSSLERQARRERGSSAIGSEDPQVIIIR